MYHPSEKLNYHPYHCFLFLHQGVMDGRPYRVIRHQESSVSLTSFLSFST